MKPKTEEMLLSVGEGLKAAAETFSGLPSPTDQFAARLQFIADLIADQPMLPKGALLVWRGSDGRVRHAAIGQELVVGRQAGPGGVSIAEDKLLSRRHFKVKAKSTLFMLQDLDSHNGTSVNRRRNAVARHSLRDGDLILAGSQVFAFLAPQSVNPSGQLQTDAEGHG